MIEVPLYERYIQGYLAHKKQPTLPKTTIRLGIGPQ